MTSELATCLETENKNGDNNHTLSLKRELENTDNTEELHLEKKQKTEEHDTGLLDGKSNEITTQTAELEFINNLNTDIKKFEKQTEGKEEEKEKQNDAEVFM